MSRRTSCLARVSVTPATRARRAEAVARSSLLWPRNGFTATVASSGKAGGTARTAFSAAASSADARDGAIWLMVLNMIVFLPVTAISLFRTRRSGGPEAR